MPAYVALIRGINVGKNNSVPKATLAGLFSDAGCEDVATYIQSGNVVFRATAKLAASLPPTVGAQLGKHLGRKADVSVVIRSANELDHVIDKNPYAHATQLPKTVHVGFLESAPPKSKVALLDPAQSDTDVFEVRGKELYLHTPHGLGKSKLTMAFFAKLGTPCTLRNWNTVLKLQSMLVALKT